MKIDKGVMSQFIFGSFDGVVTVLGVIIGLLATGSPGNIVHACIGLAAAAAVSMGGGELLGDNSSSILKAIAMGAATLFGTLIPVIPFIFLPKLAACFGTAILTVGVGFLIGHFRDKGKAGYVQTFILLGAAVAITVAVTLLIPGAGG
jgi:VIT1/CCC1 family predicted Fe2+/Mn2+ transporter